MDRSLLGSAIKVYPSKNNRTSRSYRSSSFAPQHRSIAVFQDDDEQEIDLFDQLVHEEKVRSQNQSNLGNSLVNRTAPVQFFKRSTVLHDLGNRDSLIAEEPRSIKKKKKTKKRDKENTRYHSRLFSDDEDDPYSWNTTKDGTTYSKTKRRASSKPRPIIRSDRMEQLLKIEKRKKAQELRQKLMKSRFSKVCSTPNRDPIVRDDKAPDISFISQMDSSPMYVPPSVTLTTEKSSDIFMSDTFKRVTSRKQYSSFQMLRVERKPVPLNFEFSCCDDDNHKNSGSSDAKSVESENSNYLTCLKIENSDDNKNPDEKSKLVEGCSSSRKSRMNEASGTGTDSYKTDEVDSSKHSISSSPTEGCAHGSQPSTIEASDGCNFESANSDKIAGTGSLVKKLNEISIHDTSQNDDVNDEVYSSFELCSNESAISVEVYDCTNESVVPVENTGDNDAHKLTREDLEVLDSENEFEELDLTEDFEKMHLQDPSFSEPNASLNLSQATDSGDSFYSLDLSSENEDDNEIVLQENEFKNVTFRRTSRFSNRVSKIEGNVEQNEVVKPSMVREETDSKSTCSDEQFDVQSRLRSNSITSRRGTRFFNRRSSRYSELFDLPTNTVIEDSSAVTPSLVVRSKLDTLSTVTTRKSVFPRQSVFEPVLEEDEEVVENDECTALSGQNSIYSFMIRRNRVSQLSHENEIDKSSFNNSSSDSAIIDRRVSVNNRRGTQFFDHTFKSNPDVTISYDDTFSPKEETVVAAPETKIQNDIPSVTPEVTLKLDELSPIQKCQRSVLSSKSEEKCGGEEGRESNKTRIFESTRAALTNITRIFENTSGNSSSEMSFDTTVKHFPPGQFNSTSVQSIYLEKGKKWRRSFITFKNIMNHRLTMVEKEDCGRFCNLRVQNLIDLQNDATTIIRELQECSTLKTGSDETAVAGFEEGDTISAKCERSEKARFSLSVNVVNLSRDIDIVIDDHHNSRLENVVNEFDGSYARESLIDQYHKAQAGDFNNILRSSLPLLERSCTPDVAREIVLKYCNQTEPLPFEMCFSDSELKSCLKIGEGVYGEVFMMKRGSKKSVIKIIPIEGDQLVNGERQKTFEEIFAELVITVHLSDLRKRKKHYYTECFAELKNRHCVYGRYPQRLIALWKEYDLRKGSENDSPTIFKDDQLYIIFELDHGGGDVESFVFNNAQQTLSVFNQVTNALAVAEQAFEFEHRDLHWGNILVTRSVQKKTKFVIRDRENSVRLNGVKVTIIDYTLSRISIKNHTLFNDLEKDPELFIAEGDFQFEVYRMMRKAVENEWNRYVPRTNIYWLRYLLDKMLKEIKYARSGTKLHNTCYEDLQELYQNMLDEDFDNAYQIVDGNYKYR